MDQEANPMDCHMIWCACCGHFHDEGAISICAEEPAEGTPVFRELCHDCIFDTLTAHFDDSIWLMDDSEFGEHWDATIEPLLEKVPQWELVPLLYKPDARGPKIWEIVQCARCRMYEVRDREEVPPKSTDKVGAGSFVCDDCKRKPRAKILYPFPTAAIKEKERGR